MSRIGNSARSAFSLGGVIGRVVLACACVACLANPESYHAQPYREALVNESPRSRGSYAISPQQAKLVSLKIGETLSVLDGKVRIHLVSISSRGANSSYRAVAEVSIRGEAGMTIEGSVGSQYRDKQNKFAITIQELNAEKGTFSVAERAP